MLTLEGRLEITTAAPSISITGEQIPEAPPALRATLNGLEDARLRIKACELPPAASSIGGFIHFDGLRYLPVKIGGKTVGLDVLDLKKRLHWSDKTLNAAAGAPDIGKRKFDNRHRLPKILETYASILARYHEVLAQVNKSAQPPLQPIHLQTFDPEICIEFSSEELFKILRRSYRSIGYDGCTSSVMAISGRHFIVKKTPHKPLRVVLWSGHAFSQAAASWALGFGASAFVQSAFDLTEWQQTALKIARTMGTHEHAIQRGAERSEAYVAYMEKSGRHATQQLLHEMAVLKRIHSDPNAAKYNLMPMPIDVFDTTINGSKFLACLLPRYCTTLRTALDLHVNPRLHNSFNGLTRLDILRLVRDLFATIEYLHTRHNMIHGDLKHANVLLTTDLKAVLCDFAGAIQRHQYSLTQYSKYWSRNVGGEYTRKYISPQDLDKLYATVDSIKQAVASGNGAEVTALHNEYFRRQKMRDTLAIAIVAGTILGFDQDWLLYKSQHIALDHSFVHRGGPDQVADERERRNALYGPEIQAMLEGLFDTDPMTRTKLEAAIATIDGVINQATQFPHSPMADVLSLKRPIPA